MIGSPQLREALSGSHAMTASAVVTLRGEVLAEIEPREWEIVSTLGDGQVSSTLSMSVVDPDGSLLTEKPDAPLQAYGQRVSLDVVISAGQWSERVQMGTWRISSASGQGKPWRMLPDGQWVRPAQMIDVDCDDLLELIADHDFSAPSIPISGSMTGTELVRLVAGAMPTAVDIPQRRVPSVAWESSRIDAVTQIARDAGGVALVDRQGVLRIVSGEGSGNVVKITPASPDGTIPGHGLGLVAWHPKATRDRVYNGVAMTGRTEDGTDLFALAVEPSGPTAWSDAGFGRVLYKHHSPLLTTQAAVNTAAATRLNSLLQSRAQSLEVDTAPDPTVSVLDRAEIQIPGGVSIGGLITQVRLSSAGPMRLTVSVPMGGAIYG